MARILITNHGPHPADKWAVTTAEMIFPVDDSDLSGDHLLAAKKFQIEIAEILAPHHDNVQTHERARLVDDHEHLLSKYEAKEHADAALADLVEASKKTPWAAHFAKPEVQEVVHRIMEGHFCSAKHVERLWHLDGNADHPHARTFRARFGQ